MSVSKKIKGLFWSADGKPDSDRAEDEAVAEEAPARETEAPPDAGAGASAVAPRDDISIEPDFAAIYARTGTAGDARVDQLLAAFEGMKALMPAPQLAVAIDATSRAIGADKAAVVETRRKRLDAIDAAVADELRTAGERQTARTSELETTALAVEAEIAAMQEKIAARQRQLDTVAAAVQQKNASEQGIAAAFEQRARSEAARLKALRDFLAPSDAATARK